MSKKPEDLMPQDFPKLSWEPNRLSEALNKLFDYSIAEAKRAINWYALKRAPKQLWGRILRVGAIFATGVAGVIPVLSQILAQAGKANLAPAWSTVALGIAALLVALDRFWGFTSAWVRFMLAEQALSEALISFQVDWENEKLAWGTEPTQVHAREMVAQCKTFLTKIHKIVQQETNMWAAEFHSVIAQLEEAAKLSAKTKATTAVKNSQR